MRSICDIAGVRAALDLLFPRDCVLCGGRIAQAGGAAYPLCRSCAASLCSLSGPRCPRCGKTLVSEEGLCMDCRGKEFSCGEVLPLFRYEGDAATLISAYKSGGRRSLAAFWAELLERELRNRWPGRCIVPVPPRPEKAKAGEIDQIELLVRQLETRGFLIARVLRRAPSAQQKSLSRKERLANSRAAYSLMPGAELSAEVVLLDDVFTTGATIEACAAALKAGGADRVCALVLAAD